MFGIGDKEIDVYEIKKGKITLYYDATNSSLTEEMVKKEAQKLGGGFTINKVKMSEKRFKNLKNI